MIAIPLSETECDYDFQLLPKYLELLYSRLRIAVIHGGDKQNEGAVIYKTHNPRSTKTYETVALAQGPQLGGSKKMPHGLRRTGDVPAFYKRSHFGRDQFLAA